MPGARGTSQNMCCMVLGQALTSLPAASTNTVINELANVLLNEYGM